MTGLVPPAALSQLRDMPVLHTDVEDVDDMGGFVEAAASRIFG